MAHSEIQDLIQSTDHSEQNRRETIADLYGCSAQTFNENTSGFKPSHFSEEFAACGNIRRPSPKPFVRTRRARGKGKGVTVDKMCDQQEQTIKYAKSDPFDGILEALASLNMMDLDAPNTEEFHEEIFCLNSFAGSVNKIET